MDTTDYFMRTLQTTGVTVSAQAITSRRPAGRRGRGTSTS